MIRPAQICWMLLAVPNYVTAQIHVSSDFPGGSAHVISIDNDQEIVSIRPAIERDRGWPCWWYCRLDGLVVDETVHLKVNANTSPYRSDQVLSHTWLFPDRAAISDDNLTWRHTTKTVPKNKQATYTFKATAATMWVAWGPPFLPSHTDALLRECAERLPEAQLFQLATTRNGRAVRGIRVGASAVTEPKKYGIWVQARQHAWEAGSSWVAQGFLNWLTSDAPAAIDLRSRAMIIVVPIMDVDSVSDGRGGKDAVPRDHNRDWDNDPVYPEVRAAQTSIRKLDHEQHLDLYIDLHNPGPNDRRPFFYGPKLQELSSPLRQRNYVRWIQIASDRIDDLAPEYRFAAYLKTDEERNRVSSNWVRNHSGPHVVATTLETSWNRPLGTQQGYQEVGRQLGESMASYFSGDPRGE